jgi:hypothetical protein
MKLFECQACGNVVYFENVTCTHCGHRLAYMPERDAMTALEPVSGDKRWTALADPSTPRFLCENAQHDVCNWLVPPGTSDAFCLACRHNHVIPDITVPQHRTAWRLMEMAKHRLFYSLLQWKLPLKTVLEDPSHGLSFEFLADPPAAGQKVLTGHDEGKIVIALVEANDAEREKRRLEMGEPYRTLLGHFRHEVGHHYWDILVRDAGKLDACRAVFGDDTQDYGEALKRHYDEGTPPDWREHFVSAYATTHPWEDFAETWAHYLHIVDTLEMVASSGMTVRPQIDKTGGFSATIDFNPYRAPSIEPIIEVWLPYVFAMNNVNRAMGLADLYPFVLAPPVIGKLGFIHKLVHSNV